MSHESVKIINWSIVNSNPCLGEAKSPEDTNIETGEMVRIEVKSLLSMPCTFGAAVTIDVHGTARIILFDTVILQPGEAMTLTTEPFIEPNGRDGVIIGITTNFDSLEFTKTEKRKPYSRPVLRRFEFVLQPDAFDKGSAAIQAIANSAPTCHTECTWSYVTSFLLGVILPHDGDIERLKRAATVIVPRLTELQAIATASDPVEFEKAKRVKVTCEDIYIRSSDDAKRN